MVRRILFSVPLDILPGRIKPKKKGIHEANQNHGFVMVKNCHSIENVEALQEAALFQGGGCKPAYLPLVLLSVHYQQYISVFLKNVVFLLAEKKCCQLSKLVHLLLNLSMCYQ